MRGIVVAIVLAATPAAGDAPRREDVEKAATALFEQGRQLLEAGQETAACDKFEASLRLDPQIGTKLNVAACRESHGKPLDAYRLFEEAASADAGVAGKETRAAFARERMQKLLPKLVRVKLAIPPAAAVVKLEGVEQRVLAAAEWSRELVVAPGVLAVTVTAPGYEPLRIERANAAGALATYDATKLEPVAKIVTGPERPAPRRASKLPWIVGGAGAGAIAVSFGLGLHARSRYGNEELQSPTVESAQREADIATGVFIAGAAAVTVGVVLYVRGRRAAVVPTMTASTPGAAVVGRF
jgi:hypothetical protein